MPPDVTTGLVVVVTGGGVVVVVGGLVVGGDVTWAAPAVGGTAVVVVVGGTVVVVGGTVVVAGASVDEVPLLGVGGCTAGPDGFEVADEPGCSLATTTPMHTANTPVDATATRVTRRIRASARTRARGVQ